MLECLHKLSRLLTLGFRKTSSSFTSKQDFQQSGQVKLEFLVVGMRGHERADDGHEPCLRGHQGIEFCLQLFIFHGVGWRAMPIGRILSGSEFFLRQFMDALGPAAQSVLLLFEA